METYGRLAPKFRLTLRVAVDKTRATAADDSCRLCCDGSIDSDSVWHCPEKRGYARLPLGYDVRVTGLRDATLTRSSFHHFCCEWRFACCAAVSTPSCALELVFPQPPLTLEAMSSHGELFQTIHPGQLHRQGTWRKRKKINIRRESEHAEQMLFSFMDARNRME